MTHELQNDSDDINNQLTDLHHNLRDQYKGKYDRNLPFCDEVFDRWERAKYLGFGEGTRIYDSCYVFGNVNVGRDCFIGQFCILDGSGSLEIGDNCCISAGSHIMTHDSVNWCLTGGKASFEHSSVKIGKCCYIGPQCVINRGVTIGDHCVVGANSYVNHNIPPFSIAYGTPARVVGSITITDDGQVIKKMNGKDD